MQFNTRLSLNSYFHLAFNYNFIISFHVTIYIIFMVLAELLLGKKRSHAFCFVLSDRISSLGVYSLHWYCVYILHNHSK